MRCTQSRERLSAYLDGELTPSEAGAIREHVAACADCAGEYAALAATSRQLKEGLVRYTAPDVLKARILSKHSEQPAPTRTVPAPWMHWGR